jgi:hypothetical protein
MTMKFAPGASASAMESSNPAVSNRRGRVSGVNSPDCKSTSMSGGTAAW